MYIAISVACSRVAYLIKFKFIDSALAFTQSQRNVTQLWERAKASFVIVAAEEKCLCIRVMLLSTQSRLMERMQYFVIVS